MATLMITLTGIGLLDSASITPIGLVPLLILMGAPKAGRNALAFIAGIFFTYLACGILLLAGLDQVFDAINAKVAQFMNQPDTLDLVLQILIGAVMLVLGARLTKKRSEPLVEDLGTRITPGQVFMFGAGLTIVGLPGALPYFAAIDQVLRADLTLVPALSALAYYNTIFVLPMILLLVFRVIMGEGIQKHFQALSDFVSHWGRRFTIWALIALGIFLIVDGVNWFLFGKTLLPI